MASRSIKETESRSASIKHDSLGVMYGLEKFQHYLFGRHAVVGTHHSLLEQIFKKSAAVAPVRLQRLVCRWLKIDIEVKHKQGKNSSY